jgi:hypothetical protein
LTLWLEAAVGSWSSKCEKFEKFFGFIFDLHEGWGLNLKLSLTRA